MSWICAYSPPTPPRKPVMSRDDFAKEMLEISKMGDVEIKHIMADRLVVRLLKELGYSKGAEAFENMVKWYS